MARDSAPPRPARMEARVGEALTDAITARLDRTPPAMKMHGLIAPADGLCSLCGGSGHLMCHQDGKREFWTCPACKGQGARRVFGPREVRMRHAKERAGGADA